MNKQKLLALAIMTTLLVQTQILSARENKVESKVSEVTLYRSQAMVTRKLVLKGEAGSQEIVVTDLPENIVAASLFAEGDTDIEVRAVQFRTRAIGESPRKEVRELQTKLRGVQQKIELASKKLVLLEKRNDYLDKMETFSAKTATSDLDRGVLDAEALEKITTFSFEQRTKILEEQIALQAESETLNEEKELLNRQIREVTNNSAKVTREAIIFVEKNAAKAKTIRLNYLVNSCGWSPSYTVHAKDNENIAKLEYNGMIRQMSGEDWTGVKLTLSTASPSLSASGPGLAPFQVALASRAPVPQGRALQTQNYAVEVDNPNQVMIKGKAGDIKALFAEQQLASRNAISLDDNVRTSWGLNGTVNQFSCADLIDDNLNDSQADFSLDLARQPCFHYPVESNVSLPSRNEQQLVRIMQTELPSEFYHVATPILTSYVYREATLNNSSQTDFLAGPISVYLEDRFVGRGEIPTVARGQEFIVGFGADSQLRSRRELVKKSTDINGGNREAKLSYRLVIENYKESDTEIRVVDRIPMNNENDNLRVTLLPLETELSSNEAYNRIERSKGILRWDTKVPARAIGETAFEIEYGFTLEHDRNYVVSLPRNEAQQEKEFEQLQNYRFNRPIR